MSSIAALVEGVDVGQLARDILRAHVEYQDGERTLQAAERKTEGLREEQRRRRVEIGRMLIEAKRGIKHGGWEPYLLKLGIESQRASEWMRLAGHAETKSPASPHVGDLVSRQVPGNVPTLRDAGIDKRPRKRDEQPDEPVSRTVQEIKPPPTAPAEPEEEPSLVASWKRDISKALVGLDKIIMGYAKSWPKRSRSDLARTLRSVAERIESMTGE